MVYYKSNYSKKRAVIQMLHIVAWLLFATLFAYTVYGAQTAEETARQLTREQFYTSELELRIRDLEKENRLLRQDVAILYNIHEIGDYVFPEE